MFGRGLLLTATLCDAATMALFVDTYDEIPLTALGYRASMRYCVQYWWVSNRQATLVEPLSLLMDSAAVLPCMMCHLLNNALCHNWPLCLRFVGQLSLTSTTTSIQVERDSIEFARGKF